MRKNKKEKKIDTKYSTQTDIPKQGQRKRTGKKQRQHGVQKVTDTFGKYSEKKRQH